MQKPIGKINKNEINIGDMIVYCPKNKYIKEPINYYAIVIDKEKNETTNNMNYNSILIRWVGCIPNAFSNKRECWLEECNIYLKKMDASASETGENYVRAEQSNDSWDPWQRPRA